LADDSGLSVDAGRGVAHLRGAVVVPGRTSNHGIDKVLLNDCLRQSLEDDDTCSSAGGRSAGLCIERAAVSVGGKNHARHVGISHTLRKWYRDSSSESHVTLAAENALACQ